MKKSKFIQLVIVGAALASASCQRTPIYSSNYNTGPILPPDSTNIKPDSTLFQGDTTGVYQGYYPYYYQYPYNQYYIQLRPCRLFWHRHHRHQYSSTYCMHPHHHRGAAFAHSNGGFNHTSGNHHHSSGFVHSHGAWGNTSGGFGHVSHGGFGHSGHSFSAHS